MRHPFMHWQQKAHHAYMARGPRGPWSRPDADCQSPFEHGGGRGRGDHRHRGTMGGGDEPLKRVFGHGDLRFVILSLLDERPAHGYELIKAIEEKTGGAYTPSPGVIYPTLTFLDEGGFASSTSEGGKNLYAITESGREMLKDNKEQVDLIFNRMKLFAERVANLKDAFGGEGPGFGRGRGGRKGVVFQGFHSLRSALESLWPLNDTEQAQVQTILEEAAESIRKIRAEKAK